MTSGSSSVVLPTFKLFWNDEVGDQNKKDNSESIDVGRRAQQTASGPARSAAATNEQPTAVF